MPHSCGTGFPREGKPIARSGNVPAGVIKSAPDRFARDGSQTRAAWTKSCTFAITPCSCHATSMCRPNLQSSSPCWKRPSTTGSSPGRTVPGTSTNDTRSPFCLQTRRRRAISRGSPSSRRHPASADIGPCRRNSRRNSRRASGATPRDSPRTRRTTGRHRWASSRS
jgi:hypothetical protein